MKKSEMIETLATATGLTKADSEKAFNGVFEILKGELAKGNDVAISGFGTFKVSDRKARECRNPRTGETVKVDACKAVSFKPGKGLKETVNN